MKWPKKNLYKKGLRCKHCGKLVNDRNKTGSCAHCRMTIDQRGAGNHMFGKVFSEEERKRCADATRKLWENSEYRRKVVENATGLHRGEDFRKGQSERTKASYDKIEGLRFQRRKLFSDCWKDGRNHFRTRKNGKSKEEREIFAFLSGLGKYAVTDDEVCVGGNKYLAPDMVINGKIVVEFYGDYFHANPKKHKADEYILKKEMTAQELWQVDAHRKEQLENAGYKVLVVWQNDYRTNKENCLDDMVEKIDTLLSEGGNNAVEA